LKLCPNSGLQAFYGCIPPLYNLLVDLAYLGLIPWWGITLIVDKKDDLSRSAIA